MTQTTDGFVPGACPFCQGTGETKFAYVSPALAAELLGVTPRWLRELAAEGHIPKLVRGRGYPWHATLEQYRDYRAEQIRRA
jgi:hypothetical protein